VISDSAKELFSLRRFRYTQWCIW